MKLLVFLLLINLYSVRTEPKGKNCNEAEAKAFIAELDRRLMAEKESIGVLGWNLDTNITDDNQQKLNEAGRKFRLLTRELWEKGIQFDYEKINDYSTKRQLRYYKILGDSILDIEEYNKLVNVSNDMRKLYSTAKVCVRGKCNLDLDPDLTNIMAKSRDYDELTEAWVNWRNAAGKPCRELFKENIRLNTKSALLNGFKSIEDSWLYGWESTDFKEEVEGLWQEVKPLYQKLHAFVRMKLRKVYGNRMPSDGTIPAHIVGNMWAQRWENILDLVVPYPNRKSVDVTDALKQQNYTALRIVEMADKFNKDLGLMAATPEFWNKSMLTRPANRSVVCHATAYDMFKRGDFRIKMCTEITMVDFITIHHELGHIQYYQQYEDQPVLFREGSNAGFHEAVGDTIALSVSTPSHLHKVGLYEPAVEDPEITLNSQMLRGLEKIAFLPFSYLMDLWRWDVFSNRTNIKDMNRRWWELRLQYQGVSPPVKRCEEDFDPAAKYHISNGVEYIRQEIQCYQP